MIPLSVWVNCNKICPQVDQLCPSVEKSNRISRERGQPQFMPMLLCLSLQMMELHKQMNLLCQLDPLQRRISAREFVAKNIIIGCTV